ncbi:DNA gyrase subunit A [Granulicella tundricola]|uniref:DNA gyrase subunit A n=1 Tax=Granulicella tundricola (strain ATCC BAA-1859 / DSM 23138 / MP5ACTX9) TaxID=1198114 RepID=E8X5N3_GRATM|nr:DNA gyrase subunit A [Granulicella tundricola]ADW70660.1 DNA gyrase, A subunit [Granulicella tundricola MP5ACTX9]
MADDLFPEDPSTPEVPDSQDASSNNPPPAGTPPDDPKYGQVQGRGALIMTSINIEEEMRRSYLDYSMSVIIGRALPDVRDGLKPVHRRILYGMQEMGLQFNKKYTKSAKVVGHVMGNYHPHGDSAIYDTMVRLAQPFSLRYLMVDGQGNFGSVDGDSPAAMRYTESRLTRLAGEMLADIDMDTVDFVPNYDESTLEPSVLPARVPNLIINGSSGIAVGMATNIPPHNLTEVVSACISLLQKSPQDTTPDLELVLQHVLGPDFPTGGTLFGRTNIPQAYRTGRGRFMMRAKCHIENISGGRQAIVVDEIPYQVNKSKLIERIAELVNEGIITDIARDEFRDESDRDGMRIVIGIKRGAEHQIVLNQLHKHTQMQESFSMIFLAVHNGQPKELPLDKAIRAFLDHRIEVVRRRTAFLLAKARDREAILLGLQIALDHLDQVIRIIRQSSSRADARENLFAYFSNRTITLRGTELRGITLDPAKYGIDPRLIPPPPANAGTGATLILAYRQIDAILELQLYRLTQLSIDELLKELALIRDNIAEFESILNSPAKLRQVIADELAQIRDKYGDPRRTIILDETAELGLEDLIADEQVAVTVSNTGYLKRTPISTYRQQRRGGTGRIGMKTRDEDFVAQLIIESTHAYLLCFTNSGRVYWLKIYEIPDTGITGKGKAMASLVDLQPGEKVVTILPVKNLTEEGKNILFATRNGTVKKTPLKDFSNVMSRGIIAIGIDKEDELITARITTGSDVVFLATHDGMAIRFNEQDLRPMGRPATGNRGINLRKGDFVIGAAVTPSPEAREKQRRERAEALGLLAQLEDAITEATDASLVLEGDPSDVAAAPPVSSAKLDKLDEKLGLTPCLILTVSENGFGKRTDVDRYRLQSRGGTGVINMKTGTKTGKVTSISLVDDTTEMMLISQFGKIIRIDTKQVRAAGRSTSGVKLLDLDQDDKVAAAMTIPPEDPKEKLENGTLLQ